MNAHSGDYSGLEAFGEVESIGDRDENQLGVLVLCPLKEIIKHTLVLSHKVVQLIDNNDPDCLVFLCCQEIVQPGCLVGSGYSLDFEEFVQQSLVDLLGTGEVECVDIVRLEAFPVPRTYSLQTLYH